MSLRNKLLLLTQNDNTIYQLLLVGLMVASPSLYFLCHYSFSYDSLALRLADSAICLIALGFSFNPNKSYYTVSRYTTIIAFIAVNNCFFLSMNGFMHVYLLSSITIFIALTLFCKKSWEFVAVCLLNLCATVIAYATAVNSSKHITLPALIILLLTFTLIAYVSFLVMMAYQFKFKKAICNVIVLNKTLIANGEKLRESGKKLNALINSLNNIIFEFDEDKICLNTWCCKLESRVIDPTVLIGKRLSDILGDEKAKKFDDALDYVIKYRQPTSIEHISDFGTGKWFETKVTPVFDAEGNYTSRISASVTDISEQKNYANALQENEALLLDAQAIAKTGNWSFDHYTKETYWSTSLYTILEIENVPENTGMLEYYISLVHPDDRENAYRYFSTLHIGEKNQYEHKIITPNGNVKYLKVLKGDLLVDELGNPKRSFGVLQDITETKLSEKIIKISQAELLEAQTIAKIGNWNWDVTLNKLSWSDEINNIYEIDQKTAAENNFIKLLLKHVNHHDIPLLKQLLKSGSYIPNTSHELRIMTSTGKPKYLSIIIGTLIKRDDGTIRKIIGTLQDITDRKQAEIEYKRTENKYKLVLETIKLPAISLNHEGKLIFCNKYMADLLGYEQNEILGLNWIENFIPKNMKDIMSGWFANNSFNAQYTKPVLCRSGEQRIISWQNTVSYDENGRIKEVTGIGEDITDRQKATAELISAKEEAEKSSQFKSEFLSIMSHEIRTPMNAVIGTTNLLLTEDPKPDQLEYLNILKFSGENLLAIINDILDYNKIEAGKLELNKSSFNIHNLVQKIKQSFYSKASEKELQIELVVDKRIPAYLIGDQVRLSQVLNNLLSNAIKFTHSGKVTLRLDKEEADKSNVMVKFTVADTGIGIAAENLAVIFDPFVQETQAPDIDYGGSGLGLAITKRLIELHRSSISVSSEYGKGTQFTFSIPFALGKQEREKENELSSAPNTDLAPDLRGMRILVVDDNKMNLLIASKFLKKWNVDADEALSGEIAIEMVKNNNYDVIIMDLQMPVMDGLQATRIIKTTNPQLPIIALTADAMPETFNKALSAGMCDYLTKPFVPEVLFEKIAKHYVPVES